MDFSTAVPTCPDGDGHDVAIWWVVSRKDKRIVAAASLDAVLLAFEVEPFTDKRAYACGRSPLQDVSAA